MYQPFFMGNDAAANSAERFMEKNLQEYVVLMSWQRRQEDLYKRDSVVDKIIDKCVCD